MPEVQTFSLKLERENISDADAHWMVAEEVRKGPQLNEAFQLLWEQSTDLFSIEVHSYRQHMRLCFTCEDTRSASFSSALLTMFPGSELEEIPDPTQIDLTDCQIRTCEMKSRHERVLNFLTYSDMKLDTFAPLANCLTALPFDHHVIFQIVAQPIRPTAWLTFKLKAMQYKWYLRYARDTRLWLFPLMLKRHALSNEKMGESLFAADLRIAVIEKNPHASDSGEITKLVQSRLQRDLNAILASLRFNDESTSGAFQDWKFHTGPKSLESFEERAMHSRFYFSGEEICSVLHPLSVNTHPFFSHIISPKHTPPTDLPIKRDDPEISFFAEAAGTGGKTRFGIREEDATSHFHIIGKTGAGKSKLLELLAREQLRKGNGFVLLDCHGDITDNVLRAIPPELHSKVELIEFGDAQHFPQFNPFADVREQDIPMFAEWFVELFVRLSPKKLDDSSRTVLKQCILLLLASSEKKISGMVRVLTDESFRSTLLQQSEADSLRDYFESNEATVLEKLNSEAFQYLTRLLSRLVATKEVSQVLEADSNRYDFKRFLIESRVVLVRLPKTRLSNENIALIGSIVLFLVHLASADGSVQRERGEKGYHVLIDEFQNFASASFIKVLSSATQDKMGYTLVHQTLSQLPPELREELVRRVGTFLSFQLGGSDAKMVANLLGQDFDESAIRSLDARSFYLRLQIAGQQRSPFQARTLDVTYDSRTSTDQVKVA